MLLLPSAVQGQFNYITNDGTIMIVGYTGAGGDVVVPEEINGLAVTTIAIGALSRLTITSISIPAGVTNIGSGAFYAGFYGSNLRAINVDPLNPVYSSAGGVLFDKGKTTLLQYPTGAAAQNYVVPDTVTTIGGTAFNLCTSLVSVGLPAGLETIGGSAFSACTNLASISVPSNVIYLGDSAFLNCRSLTNVAIFTGRIGIGTYTFAGCHALANIVMTNGVNSIGVKAFLNCLSLTQITIPSGVTNIAESAFYWCSNLDTVTLADSLTAIGDTAFFDCSSLTKLTIPDRVATIGDGAFYHCASLPSLTIPKSVAFLGRGAFAACKVLTGVYFEGDAPGLDPGGDLGAAPTVLYYVPGAAGWGPTLGGLPTAPWLPRVQTSDGRFRVCSNQFGFNITWAKDRVVEIDASTALAGALWLPVATNLLTGGLSYFADPAWGNYPARFYRLRGL